MFHCGARVQSIMYNVDNRITTLVPKHKCADGLLLQGVMVVSEKKYSDHIIERLNDIQAFTQNWVSTQKLGLLWDRTFLRRQNFPEIFFKTSYTTLVKLRSGKRVASPNFLCEIIRAPYTLQRSFPGYRIWILKLYSRIT